MGPCMEWLCSRGIDKTIEYTEECSEYALFDNHPEDFTIQVTMRLTNKKPKEAYKSPAVLTNTLRVRVAIGTLRVDELAGI